MKNTFLRLILAVSLGCVFCSLIIFSCGFGFSDDIYNQIRAQIISEFKKSTSQDIKIGSVSGVLINSVVLKNVSISDIAVADEIEVTYNPLKALLSRGDFIPAVSKIIVKRANVNIIRSKNDVWNAAKLSGPSTPGAASGPPPFHGIVVFQDCQGNYTDEKGYGGVALQQPFTAKVISLNGKINFRDPRMMQMDLRATFHALGGKSTKVAEVKLNGTQFLDRNKNRYLITVDNLDLAGWGDYVLPIPNLKVESGTASLKIDVGAAPLKLNCQAKLDQTAINLLGRPAGNINGTLTATEKQVVFDELNFTFAPSEIGIASTASSEIPLPARLGGTLTYVPSLKLDLKVAADRVALETLTPFFKETRNLPLKGKAKISAALTGEPSQLQLSGQALVTDSTIWGKVLSGNLGFTFKDKKLDVVFNQINFLSGRSNGKLAADFTENVPRFDLNLTNTNLNLGTLNLSGIAGQVSGSILLKGTPDDLRGVIEGSFNSGELLGQKVNNYSGNFDYRKGQLNIRQMVINSDAGSFLAKGTIDSGNNFRLESTCRGITLSGSGLLGPMSAQVERFQGSLSGTLNEAFLKNPLKTLSASGEVEITNSKIGSQLIASATGSVEMKAGEVKVKNLLLKQGLTEVNISGTTGLGVMTDLMVDAPTFNLKDLRIFDQFLPKEITRFEGSGAATIQISGKIGETLASLEPLSRLDAKGKLSLTRGGTENYAIRGASVEFEWKDRALSLKQAEIYGTDTAFRGQGKITQDGKIDARFSGGLDLQLAEPFTKKFGKVAGKASLIAEINGPLVSPIVSVDFTAAPLVYDNLLFSQVRGRVLYSNKKLTFVRDNPLTLIRKDGRAVIAGEIDFGSEDPFINLGARVDNAQLASLIAEGQKYWLNYLAALPQQPNGTFRAPAVTNDLYTFRSGSTEGFLKSFSKAANLYQSPSIEAYFLNAVDGLGEGEFTLYGPLSSLSGKISASVSQGRLKNFDYEKLAFQAEIAGDQFILNSCRMEKKKGTLTAAGRLSFKNSGSMTIEANNFPLDLMSALFPQETDFQGQLNGTANLGGTLQNPTVAADFHARRPVISGLSFDQMDLGLSFQDGNLTLSDFVLTKDQKVSFVSGQIPFGAGSYNLSASLEGDAIGVMNLFTKDLKWKSGDCKAQLTVVGDRNAPAINGNIVLSDGKIYTSALSSYLTKISGKVSINNGQAYVQDLEAKWYGARTGDKENSFSLAGTIDLSRALAENGSVGLNLSLADSSLYLDWVGVYTGEMALQNFSIAGPFYLGKNPNQLGPVVGGTINLNGGIAYLPGGKKEINAYLPYQYKLAINFNNKVTVLAGDPTRLDLTAIMLNVEVDTSTLQVSGSSNYPILVGKLGLSGGKLSVLGREFDLLTEKDQQKYYGNNSDKTLTNFVEFKGGESGSLPNLNIIALSQITEQSTVKDMNDHTIIVKDQYHIITRITGSDLAFDAFKEDTTQSPTALVQQSLTDSQIRAMLMPEFLKGALGISSSSAGNSQAAGAILDEYINNYIHARFLRNVEREMEKGLGLENFTLQYNFGKELRKSIAGGLSGDEPVSNSLGVGLAKGFFDRFFISVNYLQYFDQMVDNTRPSYFNYELSYRMTKILSLIYYREPLNFSVYDLNTGYYKVTLRAGYNF